MAEKQIKKERIVLFENAILEISSMIEDGEDARSITQPLTTEMIGGKVVQFQIIAQLDESEFIDDFTTVVTRLYNS